MMPFLGCEFGSSTFPHGHVLSMTPITRDAGTGRPPKLDRASGRSSPLEHLAEGLGGHGDLVGLGVDLDLVESLGIVVPLRVVRKNELRLQVFLFRPSPPAL